MKKLAILLAICAPLILSAQVNTNIVILSGAGTPAFDGEWQYGFDFSSGQYGYTNGTGLEMTIYTTSPLTWFVGDYFSTNFPTQWTWENIGNTGAAPAPTGSYGGTPPPSPLWGDIYLTNFWPLPGDFVTFQADGRNMSTATNMAGLEVLLDSNILYQSTLTAGNGHQFKVDGRIQWDGTNITWFAEMLAGDPSNVQVAAFGSLTNDNLGTNEFQIVPTGNTNSFILLSATITASRVPQGTIAPAGTNIVTPGAVTFKTD